jgi:hypothetical protein
MWPGVRQRAGQEPWRQVKRWLDSGKLRESVLVLDY